MAEFGDEPVMEVRIRADWSEFDDEARRRAQTGQPVTFSSEGRTSAVGGRPSLPGGGSYPTSYAGTFGTSRMESAVERLTAATEKLATVTAAAAGIAQPRDARGRFVSAGSYYNTGYAGMISGGGDYGGTPHEITSTAAIAMGAAGMTGPGYRGGGANWTFAPLSDYARMRMNMLRGPSDIVRWSGGGGGEGGLPPGQDWIFGQGPPNYPMVRRVVGGGGGRGNFINIPSAGGGADPTGRSMNPFMARFMLIEALRIGTDIAFGYRQRRMDIEAAMGGFEAEAMADLSARQHMSTSIPFGIGRMAELMRDPLGTEMSAVRMPLEEAKANDRRSQVMSTMRTYSRGLRVSSELSGMRGFSRRAGMIQANLTEEMSSIREHIAALAAEDAAVTARLRSQEEHKLHPAAQALADQGWHRTAAGVQLIGQFFTDDPDYSYANNISATSQARRARRQSGMQDAARQRAQNEMRILQEEFALYTGQFELAAAASWDVTRLPMAPGNLILGRAARDDLIRGQEDAARQQMMRQQDYDMRRQRHEEPLGVGPLAQLQAAERTAFDAQQRRDRRMRAQELFIVRRARDVRFAGAVEAMAATAGFRTFEAGLREIETDYTARAVEADPEDRSMIRILGRLAVKEYFAVQSRLRDNQENFLQADIRAMSAAVARDPLNASRAQVEGGRMRALANIPNDPFFDNIRQRTNQYFNLQLKQAEKDYRDRRYLETMGLTREEEVTGMLAKAAGPFAETYRVQAAVRNVVGSAEERAQGRLLRDRNDIENAQRERRIGINQLEGMRTNYYESFRGAEGSLFRTNLSPTGLTQGPEQILQSIDAGIKELNSNVRKGIAVGE